MICQKCGRENNGGARFCRYCGNNMLSHPKKGFRDRYPGSGDQSREDYKRVYSEDAPTVDFGREDEFRRSTPLLEPVRGGVDDRPYGERGVRYPEEENRSEGPPRILYAMIGVLSILIIAVSGLFIWRVMHSASGGESGAAMDSGKVSGDDQVTAYQSDTSDSDSDQIGEEMLRSMIGEQEYADQAPDDPGMDYTDNEEAVFSLHNSPQDFQTVRIDEGRYEFAYPKYLFNKSIYTLDEKGERYYFYHESENGIKQVPSLYVISYDDPGDILDRTNNLYNYYAGWCETEEEKPHKPGKVFKNKQNISISDGRYRGRSSVTHQTKLFIVVSNDGKKSHIWILEYPQVAPGDPEESYIDYVVQNAYRYCTFGGTDYVPRTYEDFRNEKEPNAPKKN